LPHSLPGPAYAPPLHSFPTRRSSDLAAVFHLIWFLILESPLIAAGLTAERIGGFVGVTFALWAIPLGVGLLLVQVFKRWGYRGLHDFASGCHVTRRPRPARQLRPVSGYPNP